MPMEFNPKEAKGPDNRKYARLRMVLAILIQEEVGGKKVAGFTEDISAEGACVSLEERIERDTSVSFKIKLPGGDVPLATRGVIVWNEETVYDYFGDSPNYWDRDKTYRNVIKKISPEAVEGSPWDKDSVMHYRFAAGLIVTPEEYQTRPLVPELGLSDIDIQEVRKFYPGDDGPPVLPELVPYLSQLVRIEPGEQLDFVIHPLVSRRYTMQTFGSMDTVMVLFEDVNGEPTYIAGDDDSGTRYNARIEQRLLRNRTYYLRLRLYHSRAAGEGGIMLW